MTMTALDAGVLLAAYLLGSLSGSLLLGRLRGVDIRRHGSGNAGGTNALRTLGWRFALGVVAIDLGKGALAAGLGLRLAPGWAYPAAALAVVGHVWPLWHGFRGGKGAAAAVGALLVLWPLAVPPLLLVWLAVLVASGYVGLATVLAALGLPLLAWWQQTDGMRMGFAVVMALFLLFTHRGNLQRLRRGTESRFERARLWHRWRSRA
ncbi:glycerol-3-phosphate 1-O-acyltransferase PlsY [Thermomonas sp. S9]|uniref:glycerol-3-phosphate 1-O-acyltransferase PlsY n=1 Tax=Thermomonas sp. S9 TaxID=2885203 RepID=UPI00216AD42B|nr:glycerol-3-phosphate 1-O-acyltransferase PlsY [Thermomonas sp. S9]MCR6495277.1 glycerol-3-phosphate 1-O-acyltransferase PlsY [Thermomonas sp. S9]